MPKMKQDLAVGGLVHNELHVINYVFLVMLYFNVYVVYSAMLPVIHLLFSVTDYM